MTLAIKLISDNGYSFEGILISNPCVGEDCCIYLGKRKNFTISKVRGWIKSVNSNNVIIFDSTGHKFYMTVIANSSEFLI